jgi:hypothetical protein
MEDNMGRGDGVGEVNSYTCNIARATWVMTDQDCIARTRTRRLSSQRTLIDRLSLTSCGFVGGKDGRTARIGGQINLYAHGMV